MRISSMQRHVAGCGDVSPDEPVGCCLFPRPYRSQLRSAQASMSDGAHTSGAEWVTHRSSKVYYSLSCDVCLLVIILNLNVDDVYRLIKVSSPCQQV